jgi:hypothetical protein
VAKSNFSEFLDEFERLISYSKHYDCQIDNIDWEARFVLKELAGKEIIDDLSIKKNFQVRLKTLKQLAKQRRIEVQAKENLKIEEYLEELSKK